MKTGTIKQTASFNASPQEVYELLMDAKKHALVTGSKVKISNKEKGPFVTFDGYCHGFNVELIPGEKIVQAWHFAEDGWPDDHFSICTFEFKKAGKGTKLNFKQVGVPKHKIDALNDGWRDFYWKPMKDYLASLK